MTSISNGLLTISAKTKGGELCSLKDANGIEYLWQADPAIWARHAPVLFPFVGKLRDDRYKLNGKIFEMPKHGFARETDFSLIKQTPDSLTYQLLPTEKTRPAYPFEFALTIEYRLNGSAVDIRYEVRNNGSVVMPFSIGAHPGFNLPGPIDECFLEFEKSETLNGRLLDSQKLLSAEPVPVLKSSKVLNLSKTLFDRGALICLSTESKKITLGSRGNSRRVSVEFQGFPQLGIWAERNAPYVCIEPWYGYDDEADSSYGDIMNRPGTQLLAAGKSFVCTHRIIVEA